MHAASERPLIDEGDTTRRFVRYRGRTGNGFVEFSFGIGDADLMVDLVLPFEGYVEFCRVNRVELLSVEEGEAIDHERAKWARGTPEGDRK